jgi:hypothetical protein
VSIVNIRTRAEEKRASKRGLQGIDEIKDLIDSNTDMAIAPDHDIVKPLMELGKQRKVTQGSSAHELVQALASGILL